MHHLSLTMFHWKGKQHLKEPNETFFQICPALDNSFWAHNTTVFLKAPRSKTKSFYRGMTDPLIVKSVKTSAYCGRCTEFLSQSTTSKVVQLWTAINTWHQVRWLKDSSLVAFETACKLKSTKTIIALFWF